MITANYIPGSYSHLSFGGRCVLFAIAYILFFAALKVDGWIIKGDKYMRIVMALVFIMISAVTVGEFAAHFSWPSVIADIAFIISIISVFLVLAILILRNKRLTGDAFSFIKPYIPENRRHRYGRRRRNRYKLK